MTFILASARSSYEFRSADAINDMGGYAVVPRRIEITKRKDGGWDTDYRPFLPNFLFVSVTEEMWFSLTRKRLFSAGTILPPIRRQLDILPRTWADFTAFAQRAELACDLRLEQHEAGLKVARYRKGDMLRIIGDELLTGQLQDKLAKFIGVNAAGQIEAEVQDITMMGKPVTVRLGPGDVMAAE